MSEFKSGFAVKIAEMLEFREAMGFKPETHMAYLLKLDAFCCEQYPEADALTEAVVLDWLAVQGGTSGSVQAIRALGIYLQAIGESAYVLPETFSSGKSAANTYIFTDLELSALFREIDRVSPTEKEPHLNIIAPVMFRLTYTCGLRPNESRELLAENVSLNTGEIFITNTKKHRERVVVMSDDMLGLCKKYSEQRLLFGTGSAYFFPSWSGAPYSSNLIDRLMKSCWAKANPGIPKNELPSVRVYSLRHRFASACLNRWLDQKRDLSVMLPYLRAYMGHLRMDDTLYYVQLLPEKISKSPGVNWAVLDSVLPGVSSDA